MIYIPVWYSEKNFYFGYGFAHAKNKETKSCKVDAIKILKTAMYGQYGQYQPSADRKKTVNKQS